ncbi:MAG: aminoacyl-histidine dipeptidase [Melioribacteraceae bacterium]|nr:aminoacyl-histidine dipeptidase [Melioribacteraceae bacterium]
MLEDVIKGLKPEIMWKRFFEITQVPRPSKREEKILDYLRAFAAEHNIELKEDETHNIVMKVPATPGYENSPVVVMQSHIDMVCEKNKGTEHDFDNDPLTLINEGEWITAKGTTLGADNGIGMAGSLSVITDKSITHGPLELLFTVDEETGMTGVNGLQPGFVEGRILLNMDSEEDGAFYVGCCGGQDTVGLYSFEMKQASEGLTSYELMITGLKGGHSGLDIHIGRANAIKLLGRLLRKLDEVNFEIADIKGGSLRNAIPREAEVTILINKSDEDKVKSIISGFVEESLLECKTNDGGLAVKFEEKAGDFAKVYSKEFIETLIKSIYAIPHGVMAMSPDIPGLVETSTNLATIMLEDGKLRIGTSQRSSIESAKLVVTESVRSVFELAGAEAKVGDGYPGWQPNVDSELLKISKDVFKNLFNKEPEIKAIHAGLECGLLGAKYPGMDMISFGPTIQGAHSPDEKVNIADVERFYALMKGMLEKIAGK